MQNLSEAYVTKTLLFAPIGVAAVSRGIGLFPLNPRAERLPAPAVFEQVPAGPYVFSSLWVIAGLLLLVAIPWGHKITIFKPEGATARLRLDDLGIILTIGLTAVWGISYYFSYFYAMSHPPPNTDYVSGRNYLPYAIAMYGAWRYWFMRRESEPETESNTTNL